MSSKELLQWELWAEYCNDTHRESKWGNKIGKLLTLKKLLPSKKLVDIGCGTGEFTKELKSYTPKVIGIDQVDIRNNKDFIFEKSSYEKSTEINGADILIFKQSYHLVQNPNQVLEENDEKIIIIAQMPKPKWDSNKRWENKPLNAQKNYNFAISTGRECGIERISLRHKIDLELLEKMFRIGYTSDLQKKSEEERDEIWTKEKVEYENKGYFEDVLDVIFCQKKVL